MPTERHRGDWLVGAAAISAVLAIATGTFAAHAATGRAIDLLRTGGHYQLIHAVVVILLATRARFSAKLMLLGATVFAVSLYVLAMGAPHWVGAVTPLGGIGMIAGWLCLAVKELRYLGQSD